MMPFRDFPLRRKMISIILLASIAALLVTASAGLIYEVTTFRPSVERDTQSDAVFLAPNIVAAVRFFDSDAATEDLRSLRMHPTIRAAATYTPDGTLFARYVREDAGGFDFPESPGAVGGRQGPDHIIWVEELVDEEENETVGWLYLHRDLPPILSRLPHYGLMVIGVVFALVAAGLGVTVALERQVSKPILELAQASQRVREQQSYRVRVDQRGNDEIGRLTEAFNQMLATIEQREGALRQAGEEQRLLQEELMQAQKMESIGRLAGGVAHDFNNLLTVVVGSTELALRRLSQPDRLQAHLEQIRRATEQAGHLTHQLLAFARKQVLEPRVLHPARLVLDVEKMLRRLIGADVELQVMASADVWCIKADPTQVTQVLVNLAVNARDAMPAGGSLTIEIHNAVVTGDAIRDLHGEHAAGEYVVLAVTDTGVGMDGEVQRKIFEPFFTTKEAGRGTGLGLATCYGIVKQNGGLIAVFSEVDEGTTFKIYLPRTQEPVDPSLAPEGRERVPGGSETVLVVEDNPLVRSTAVELLRAQGYTVLEAGGGPEALDLVRSLKGEIDLLVTDVVMPQMSGQDVAWRLQEKKPELKVLYVSGYTADVITTDEHLPPDIAFLQKPFTSDVLAKKVRAVLDTA